jgi:alginate O-acetyltransferase complex protein AlgI
MALGGPNNLWIGELQAGTALLIVLAMLVWHWLMRNTTLEEALTRVPWPARSLGLAALILALCVTHGDGRAFIYFQF